MNSFVNFIIRFIYLPEEYVDSSGRITALSSFTIGILLLTLFIVFKIDFLIAIGILFVIFYLLINGIILFILFIKIGIKLFTKQPLKSHLITLFTMLINIPITIIIYKLCYAGYIENTLAPLFNFTFRYY